MESDQARLSWNNIIKAWITGLLATAVLGGIVWLITASAGLTASGAAGRLAITLGLSAFIGIMLADIWATHALEKPLRSTVVLAIVHVVTFIAAFLVLLTIRTTTGIDAFAPIEGSFAQQVGPAAAIAAIMCVAAVNASIFSLCTIPTPDERAWRAAH